MKKPILSIIAAIDLQRGIGIRNKIPWHIKKDFAYFKQKTLNHPVIMGRTTFESILKYNGKPLTNRVNIILTKNIHFKYKSCIIAHTIKQAIKIASKIDKNEIFIIGGTSLYNQTIDIADRLYLTIINQSFNCDTFFPNYARFNNQIYCKRDKDDKYSWKWIVLERI